MLIPKIKSPKKVSNFQPISLCVYKIITKTIANRLNAYLSYIISAKQSAFVPYRLITNNVTVAFELMLTIRLNTGGKKELMALKLDMSKVYDQVKWSFLKAIQIGVFPTMGRSYYGLCVHIALLFLVEWRTGWSGDSISRNPSRLPPFTVPFSHLCRGFFRFTLPYKL